jgi:hypothetical protein
LDIRWLLTPATQLMSPLDQSAVKFVKPSPYADTEAAARLILEIANTIEPKQDGRLHIEKINGPFLFKHKGTPTEYGAGMKPAIESGRLRMTRATFVRFTPGGVDLLSSASSNSAAVDFAECCSVGTIGPQESHCQFFPTC